MNWLALILEPRDGTIVNGAAAAKKEKTVSHLPRRVRTALGKKGAAAAQEKGSK